jgi:hypothetical protein
VAAPSADEADPAGSRETGLVAVAPSTACRDVAVACQATGAGTRGAGAAGEMKMENCLVTTAACAARRATATPVRPEG